MLELTSTLLIVGASQGLFLGFILLLKEENRTSNRILAVFLLTMSISMLGRYFMSRDMVVPAFFIGTVGLPSITLFGPLLYLYTHSMTMGKSINWKRQGFHFIPFVLLLLTHVIIIYKELPDLSYISHANKLALLHHFKYFIIPTIGFGAVSGLSYTIYSWYLLIRFTGKAREFFSDIERLRLTWLRLILGLTLAIFFSMNIYYWIHTLTAVEPGPNGPAMIIPAILNVITIFTTAFYVLRQPDIFNDTRLMDELEEEVKAGFDAEPETSSTGKYGKHSLDNTTAKRYLDILLTYMEEKKPYLKEGLTLKDLVEELEIPAHHLSIVVNRHLDKNFYGFINEYRIKNAKAMLADQAYSSYTVLNIALDSGFNSKSAFNNIFKQSTGLTPTEYRKKQPEAS